MILALKWPRPEELQASYWLHRRPVFEKVKVILQVEGKMAPGKNLDLEKEGKAAGAFPSLGFSLSLFLSLSVGD